MHTEAVGKVPFVEGFIDTPLLTVFTMAATQFTLTKIMEVC